MRRVVHKLGTLLDVAITYPIFLLSLLSPRDKQLWVFIGWHNSPRGEIFADNTKYLFLHTHQHAPSVRAVWLAKNETLAQVLRAHGYESYRETSLRGVWCALRAGFTVIDAYLQRRNFRWSGRSKIIQLLHGKGVKRGGYAKKQYRRQHYIFGPSKLALDLLPSSFTRRSKMFVTGYPRSDIFFKKIPDNDISADTGAIEKMAALKQQHVRCVLYAPTYRRGSETLDVASMLNLDQLAPLLARENTALFMSLHPKYRAQARNHSYPNVYFLEESDVQVLLPHVDLLVADYSSLFTDFLLLDKPLVFYPFDREQYEREEGFNVDYDAVTPGEKAYRPGELLAALERALKDDRYREARTHVRKRYHAYADGRSSERILDTIAREEGVQLR